MPAGDRTLNKGALLAHLGHLGGGYRRHGDLGELRQIQHTLRMLIVHAGSDQTRRVVADHVQHRKSEGFPGELVGAIPHLACRLRAGTDLHTHALVLDALAREGIGGFRGGQPGGRRHHQLATDFRRHLQNLCAQVDSDAVYPKIDLVTGFHHAQEAGGPPDQPAGRDRVAVGGGNRVLGGCREPHAVHDRGVKTGQQRGGPVGMDGIVVT